MSRCLVLWLIVLNGWVAVAQVSHKHEPLGPSSRKTGLVISELMYNPRVVTTTNESLEFIELYNSSAWPENISGCSITGSVYYVFPPNTEVQIRHNETVHEIVRVLEPFGFYGFKTPLGLAGAGGDVVGSVYETFLTGTLRGDLGQYLTHRNSRSTHQLEWAFSYR